MKTICLLLCLCFADIASCETCLNRIDCLSYMYNHSRYSILDHSNDSEADDAFELVYLRGILDGLDMAKQVITQEHEIALEMK